MNDEEYSVLNMGGFHTTKQISFVKAFMSVMFEVTPFHMLKRDSALTTHVRTRFSNSCRGIFMHDLPNTMYGDACQCKEHGVVAEVKTKSS